MKPEDYEESLAFYQEELVRKFLDKRVGDKVALNLVGRVEEISKSCLRISLDTATVGNTLLSFREAATQAEEEITRTGLYTEPSPG